jgi:hypothetical protein
MNEFQTHNTEAKEHAVEEYIQYLVHLKINQIINYTKKYLFVVEL